jgi:hypothetical protein
MLLWLTIVPLFVHVLQYNKFSTMEDGTDDIIRPWLEGFVNTDVDAIEMIKDAGKLDLPLVVA